MTNGNSTKAKRKSKPAKPFPEFPLTAHPRGQWCKSISGKVHYFGRWEDPDAALEKFNQQKEALYAGLDPNAKVIEYDQSEITVEAVCNLFLESKLNDVESREIESVTFETYKRHCKSILEVFGRKQIADDLRPTDFQRLRNYLCKPKATKVKNKIVRKAKSEITFKTVETRITHCRAVFNWAVKNYFIKTPLPQLWGTKFEKPSRKNLKKESNLKPSKLAERSELITLLDQAGTSLKAMILLGLNCGFGNTDLSVLTFQHINFVDGFVELPREKTGQKRKAYLWAETIEAINNWIEQRPEPKDAADKNLVFLTSRGTSCKPKEKHNCITTEFTRLKIKAKLDRAGLSFYSMRHTFQTIADDATLDFVGVRSVMGHTDATISGNYRHGVSDERLKRIADAVRVWLFEGGEK